MNQQIYKKYAEVLVKIGVNLQPKQTVIIMSPPQAYELVKEIAKLAYDMGAMYVRTEFEYSELNSVRLRHSADENIAYYPEWLADYMAGYAEDNICMISLFSPNPTLFDGIDTKKITLYQNGVLNCRKKYIAAARKKSIHSVGACYPSVEWAKAVYPDLLEEEAMLNLWNDVITINRLSVDDPVGAWSNHKQEITERRTILDNMKIKSLRFYGPDTDLKIDLINDSVWTGGYYTDEENGLQIVPNIPTEEIFNVPYKYGVNGYVTTTLPLNCDGNIIEKISLTFKDGKIIDFSSDTCYEILKNIIETDEGTRYLGEVALVGTESPIYKTGKIFYTTLYDENAVCHIAIGNSIASAIPGATKFSDEEKEKIGLNKSMAHVDVMIGSDQVSVDAVLPDGSELTLLNNGVWCI